MLESNRALTPEEISSLRTLYSVAQSEVESLRSLSWQGLNVVSGVSVLGAAILGGILGSNRQLTSIWVVLAPAIAVTLLIITWLIMMTRLTTLQGLARMRMEEIEARLVQSLRPLYKRANPLQSSRILTYVMGFILIAVWWGLVFALDPS